MGLTLPYPGQPASNSALQSLPVLQNINALAQAIQSFDGSQITAGSITSTAFATNINPNTILHDTIQPFVQSGCTWAAVSGLVGTMTGGTIYVGPSGSVLRVIVNGVGSHTFTASQDTYIDIDYNGNITYSAVANGATSPSLTANSIRVAKVITNGTTISSVQQWGYDSVTTGGQLNYIYNTSPVAAPIFTYINTGTGNGTFYYKNQSGKKELWGSTGGIGVGALSATSFTLSLPTSFFNTVVSLTAVSSNLVTNVQQFISCAFTLPISAPSGISFYANNQANASGSQAATITVSGF